MPERVAFYDNLTALQNMKFYAEIKNASIQECQVAIADLGLQEAMHKKVGTFSKGMIQRLGMARAILGNPPILILDEPSSGLDPRGVKLIRDKVLEMKEKGTSIFISSHILSEIQAVSDRIAIINKGRMVAQNTVEELRKELNLKPKLTIELEEMTEKIKNAVHNINEIEHIRIINKIINVICEPSLRAKIIIAIEKAGGTINNIHTSEPSLEEVFMRITEGE